MQKQPSLEVQQKVLHSPFDIETHKNTFVSYLEVVISPEGTVEYAVPSHTDKLVEIFAKQKGFDDILKAKKYIIETAINNGMLSTIDYLTGVTGYISVWFKGYVAGDPPTKAQLNKLKELFDNGVYVGPTWDTVTPKREELEQIVKDIIRLAKERDDENVCETSSNADK
ncbi:MAG: hypothetical protein IKU29_04065 [Parabacteroides sp.]|nr:hypothetical protein [Parabacteroides sp.]